MKTEEKRINEDIRNKKCAAYWVPNHTKRFSDHLENSRRKFRKYPNYKTGVVFFDFYQWHLKQIPEELLKGNFSVRLKVPKKNELPIRQEYAGYKDRSIRHDLNQEIGAVIFCKDNKLNSFKIFHNVHCDKNKRIDLDLFSKKDDEHFLFENNEVIPIPENILYKI